MLLIREECGVLRAYDESKLGIQEAQERVDYLSMKGIAYELYRTKHVTSHQNGANISCIYIGKSISHIRASIESKLITAISHLNDVLEIMPSGTEPLSSPLVQCVDPSLSGKENETS